MEAEATVFDLQRQFDCVNDKTKRRFLFNARTNKTNSYSISYHECDGGEVNAWIILSKAIKRKI